MTTYNIDISMEEIEELKTHGHIILKESIEDECNCGEQIQIDVHLWIR